MLSLLGGVGGSFLLEMLWRPRRELQRVMGLLGAEIAFNANLLLHHAHSRNLGGPTVPGDLLLSTMAWTAAGNLVREIPTDLLNDLILLYNRFRSLNHYVEKYDELMTRSEPLEPLSPERARIGLQMRRTEDVFNTGVDATREQCKAIAPELIRLGKIPKSKNETTVDIAANVNQMLADRRRREGHE